jgi:hypothetical protein
MSVNSSTGKIFLHHKRAAVRIRGPVARSHSGLALQHGPSWQRMGAFRNLEQCPLVARDRPKFYINDYLFDFGTWCRTVKTNGEQGPGDTVSVRMGGVWVWGSVFIESTALRTAAQLFARAFSIFSEVRGKRGWVRLLTELRVVVLIEHTLGEASACFVINGLRASQLPFSSVHTHT